MWCDIGITRRDLKAIEVVKHWLTDFEFYTVNSRKSSSI